MAVIIGPFALTKPIFFFRLRELNCNKPRSINPLNSLCSFPVLSLKICEIWRVQKAASRRSSSENVLLKTWKCLSAKVIFDNSNCHFESNLRKQEKEPILHKFIPTNLSCLENLRLHLTLPVPIPDEEKKLS